MRWFEEKLPIRQKMFILFVSLIPLAVLATLCPVIGFALGFSWVGCGAGLLVTGGMLFVARQMREGICGPYIATVVRMEGLAAGDLDTPIAYTNYLDCVGRMTKAMFTFRGIALVNQRQVAAQRELVELLRSHLSALRGGDLTARIVEDVPPEYAAVKGDFNDAIDGMRDIIAAVFDSATAIQSGSVEIAQASEDLARRTESNAASLEQTAASVAQIDDRLRTTAMAAARTVERADEAMATVGDGRAVAEQAAFAMARASESAKGIDVVIEGLDKIAFQTRVLAMNAAVEAGRAGDAGRGFAVVADLVSALAMRAEEEAKRARDQLTVTQAEVMTAAGAVDKVDGALADILKDVSEVNALLARMAADNQAQSAAITQISAAVEAMDRTTQQNAAMVEQTSAAARNLATEVLDLNDKTVRFTVDIAPGYRAVTHPPAGRFSDARKLQAQV